MNCNAQWTRSATRPRPFAKNWRGDERDRREARVAQRLSLGSAGANAGNGLDVSAYRCVDVAARNRQNCRVHRSPLWPVVTRHEPLLQRAKMFVSYLS